jgi:hypothetical protein
VRVNDLVEHIERVRGHARRLEGSVESAVQLHFSATAHRTNQIMRTMTVLTAIFMPLTLITGIFGMNFEFIPGVHSPAGFGWTLGLMGAIQLVKDKSTGQLFDSALSVGMVCRGPCFGNGLIMRAVGDRMIIAPPLVTTLEQIDELMRLIRYCLDLTLADVRQRGWI